MFPIGIVNVTIVYSTWVFWGFATRVYQGDIFIEPGPWQIQTAIKYRGEIISEKYTKFCFLCFQTAPNMGRAGQNVDRGPSQAKTVYKIADNQRQFLLGL